MSSFQIDSNPAVIELNKVIFQWPNSDSATLDIEQLSVKANEHVQYWLYFSAI